MSKHTVTAFVHWERPYGSETPFKVYPFDMSSTGCVLVGQQQIEVDIPEDFNPVPKQIEQLEKEREAARKEFADKVIKIDERIRTLQAIEYTPDTTQAHAAVEEDEYPF